MPRARIKGGRKLAAFIRDAKAASRRDAGATIGFHDRRIAGLAARLEFGDPKTNLPERPAFRNALDAAGKAAGAAMTEAAKRNARAIFSERGQRRILEAGALAGYQAIRDSYLTGSGLKPVGEAQEARKRGTPGEGRPLVGHKGPKLIDRITIRIDGQEWTPPAA